MYVLTMNTNYRDDLRCLKKLASTYHNEILVKETEEMACKGEKLLI